MSIDAAQLDAAISDADIPPDLHKDVFERLEGALAVYEVGWAPAWETPRRGPKRDHRLEILLIGIAVQWHVAHPKYPGVTKRGSEYPGPLVEFTQAVLDLAGIHPATRNLGRLIYSVVRKEAQIHGDLKEYPPLAKRSRAGWKLSTDVRVPQDPVQLSRLYRARRTRKA